MTYLLVSDELLHDPAMTVDVLCSMVETPAPPQPAPPGPPVPGPEPSPQPTPPPPQP